jgi:transketolase
VKPLDTEALAVAAERVPLIVSVEEHSIVGGLGSAIAEYLAENDLLAGRRFRRIGFNDVFPTGYGDQVGMMRRHGISAEAVVGRVKELLGNRRRVRMSA